MLRPLAAGALALGLALGLTANAADARCFADYKAKKDNPLQMHYGVAELPDAACDRQSAQRELAARLQAGGWTLLNVISTFGPEGLDERKADAGAWFLRY